jgi:hypothetical protein
MDELAEDIAQLGVAGETGLAIAEYIIGTSRKLDKPLAGGNKSTTATGKSKVLETIISLLPPEDVLVATDITQNALYYLPPGSLRHKLVVVGERKHMGTQDDAASANGTLALREMLSRGCLDKLVPMKSEGGQICTQRIHQPGPIAYLETTTEQEIFEEDATRMLSLATDESAEQTAAIMQLQAKQAAGRTISEDAREAIRDKHRTAQRLLKKCTVRIPFAEKLLLPQHKVIARRAFPQLLGFIEAVALLRQLQKTAHDDGHIVATTKDYEITYRLMTPILRRAFSPMSERALGLFGVIRGNTKPSEEFDRADCSRLAGVGLTEVRNRLALLVESGMVEQVSGGRGVRYRYKITSTTHAKLPALEGLVTPEQLRKALKTEKTAKKKAKTKKKKSHKQSCATKPSSAESDDCEEQPDEPDE